MKNMKMKLQTTHKKQDKKARLCDAHLYSQCYPCPKKMDKTI
jgi:hypothetical protein